MKITMYTLYDGFSKTFGDPFYAGASPADLPRVLSRSNIPELKEFAGYYSVYRLGYFDKDAGQFIPDRSDGACYYLTELYPEVLDYEKN